ncbi:inositol phospholipid synthesis and fat-storage-inducing TM-domain-containing protein [Flagelloscypha sp. PMI_526]|nr:inositol phospholipid synthesis and fat-storage-inducing TM-domain-containing protein [Flagelloscypha sp. PMI_526]
MANYRIPLFAVTGIVLFGTLYSVVYNTYLDTSDPLLTHLPHPLQGTDYWANKSNWMNVYFIKKAWGWTTLAFLLAYFTSPPSTMTLQRFTKYLIETGTWLVFASWFFGPPLLERLIVASGGECFLPLPNGEILSVAPEHCYEHRQLSPQSHPDLFASTSSLVMPTGWGGKPRLRKGHDVSGHIFLLTMSILFLWDQVQPLVRVPKKTLVQWVALSVNLALMSLWLFASYTTSVYFHTPLEKLTGFLFGIAGYALCQIPSAGNMANGQVVEELQKTE